MKSKRSICKSFLFFFILLLAICHSSRAQFDPVIQNLEEHNRKTLNEMVFLHVDREIPSICKLNVMINFYGRKKGKF